MFRAEEQRYFLNELAVGQVEDEEGEIGSSAESYSLILNFVQMGNVIARTENIIIHYIQ